ncbi:hypothetical protein BDZ85DRAFT_297637 [Elsinoe ampelina]|uniref:Uncharacterized protein n=1 Tax=Elsinoe ampelina TaxID=302913 RepID=A0A6A6G583_9PEZI|nr:hypothetical protein BDZ85DRAFT_297637 [Elsinoe ampelina]
MSQLITSGSWSATSLVAMAVLIRGVWQVLAMSKMHDAKLALQGYEAIILGLADRSAPDRARPNGWSVQTELNNRFANGEKGLLAELCALAQYTKGSTYWTAKFFGNATVDGRGRQSDYWSHQTIIGFGYTKGMPTNCCT